VLDDEGVRDTLKRCRMLIGAVRAPRLRQDLASALDGGADVSPQVAALRWFDDGEPDQRRLADDAAAIGRLLSEHGILAYGPISEWPAREQDRPGLAHAVVDRAFVGERRGWLTEVELNARLAMLFFDPSGLRRFAVDTGILEREADGSRYWRATDQRGIAAV